MFQTDLSERHRESSQGMWLRCESAMWSLSYLLHGVVLGRFPVRDLRRALEVGVWSHTGITILDGML